MTDLRSRVEAAIRSAALATDLVDDDGELVIVHVDNALDAVMAVVDGVLHCVANEDHGKCRWCYQLVNEAWAKSLRKEARPHRMRCRFYVGPVGHRKAGGFQMLTHWATECSCGTSWDRERAETCPNSSETWRGPTPPPDLQPTDRLPQLSDQSVSPTEGTQP